jgi:glycosyltransferase involved in cell wall biosynthesis
LILGIDATNIRTGGGLVQLKMLLKYADPPKFGFTKVIIWGNNKTLSLVENRNWLIKKPVNQLGKNLFIRTRWRVFKLPGQVVAGKCNLLFSPGSSFFGNYNPLVTLSQNLLPFDSHEVRKYGLSLMRLKLYVLRIMQARTFNKAQGIIFLTEYARENILGQLGKLESKTTIIPHGIDQNFFNPPKKHLSLEESRRIDKPFKLIYVSMIDHYKHQWNVVYAANELKKRNIPVELHLIGPANPQALKKLEAVFSKNPDLTEYCLYHGEINNQELPEKLSSADIFIFASSCENMPIILLEGMASGLPIACSDRGPMPEILGDAGVYFNPEDVGSIANAIETLVSSKKLMTEVAEKAYVKAQTYSWELCADKTFRFLKLIASRKSN